MDIPLYLLWISLEGDESILASGRYKVHITLASQVEIHNLEME